MAKFCTNCGNELPENAAMCVRCGKMVNENISTNKNTSNGNDKKKKGLPTWAIVLIVIGCVIIIPIIIVAVLTIVTFKYVKEDIIKKISKIQDETTIVIDAPLLFEAELDKMCDKVIGIIAPREMQIERVVARDDIDYEDVEKRLAVQANDEFFIENCDYIIKNDDGFNKLEKQLNNICSKIGIEKRVKNN